VIYQAFFRLILRRFSAEDAHMLASRALGIPNRIRLVRRVLRRLLGPRDPVLRVQAFGMTFPSPLGVAAGMDKDATWFEGLGAIGFGFVEIGTVTPHQQDGNPEPAIERFVAERALMNWQGFPSGGADAVACRLDSRSGETIVGVNIGKARETTLDQAPADYRYAISRLAQFADYLVLNVSSPNTPDLRSMQAADRLQTLVEQARAELLSLRIDVPLLVKIAPDMSDDELDQIADVCLALGVDGLIAVNTTIDRAGLMSRLRDPTEPAGVSGAPLKPRAVEVLRRLRARVGDSLVLVSVGGIETADDAWVRILAGATLVQAHTGFVYGGPLWPHRLNRELARRVRGSGGSSLQALVGTEVTRDGSGADSTSNGGSAAVESARIPALSRASPTARA
jgi:dihydroorotate dehydrogenase